MLEMTSPAEILRDPQVKSYFYGILASNLPVAGKYEKFIEFFEKESLMRLEVLKKYNENVQQHDLKSARDAIERLVLNVGKGIGFWDPSAILESARDSISNALIWLQKNQNKDGGWGYEFGSPSVFWETAFSTLCLISLRPETLKIEIPLNDMLSEAQQWLNNHFEGWEFHYGHSGEAINAYNVGLAIMCFFQIGADTFKPDFKKRIDEAINRLIIARRQNEGWPSRDWSSHSERQPLEDALSEIGATSFAMRALAELKNPDHLSVMDSASRWVMAVQNKNGSWSDLHNSNMQSISKTCDGILALLAAENYGLSNSYFESSLERAVIWLQGQERAIIEEGVISGWGWDTLDCNFDERTFKQGILPKVKQHGNQKEFELSFHEFARSFQKDSSRGRYLLKGDISEARKRSIIKALLSLGYGYNFTDTCLTLEALVQVRGTSLPLLTENVKWLIANQVTGDNNQREGGHWSGNTARITLSLIRFIDQMSLKMAQ